MKLTPSTTSALLLLLTGCGASDAPARPVDPATPSEHAAVSSPATPPSAGPAHEPAGAHAHAVHWAYSGEDGPEKWGDLAPEFALCKKGTRQTPVDLPSHMEKDNSLEALEFNYPPIPLSIVHNGHTIQVSNTVGAWAQLEGERYDLVQLHFHSPSEHTVDGKHYDVEAHFVHRSAKGELAVVGVLLSKGKENALLEAVLERTPVEISDEPRRVAGVTVDAGALIAKNSGYYDYIGSLTTPPCTEGVKWFVLTRTAEVSGAQIAKLRALTGGETSRPVQQLGGRHVAHFEP